MPSADELIVLRPATETDLDALAAVNEAQDIEWWGVPDGDVDDVSADLDRARLDSRSLDQTSRVAISRTAAGDDVVGFALLFAHGQSNLAVDPASGVSDAVSDRLVRWLVDAGATQLESPAQDADRREVFSRAGLVATRSSFDLERPPAIDDLGPAAWPGAIAPVPFRPGLDDEEVHTLVYSVWTDVAGHTHRPMEEWRTLFLQDVSARPQLVVVARLDDGLGPVAGVAICRTFADGVGWVSQLAVGRPAQGRGLGRALLVEAFHRLATLDVRLLGLSVEAENAAALGLYRSVGLAVTREWVHYAPG